MGLPTEYNSSIALSLRKGRDVHLLKIDGKCSININWAVQAEEPVGWTSKHLQNGTHGAWC